MKTHVKHLIILILIATNAVLLYFSQYIPHYKPATAVFYGRMVCNFSEDIQTQFPNAYLYKYLHPLFKKYGFDMQCPKTNPLDSSSLIFVGKNKFNLPNNITTPSYLWLEETPFSVSIPASAENEQRYRKIFTYSQKIVDNKKYFYLPLPYDYENKTLQNFPSLSDKKTLVIQIAGNLFNKSRLNNYNKRREAVKYFVKNHPEDFLLYGYWWENMLPQFSEEEKENFLRIYKKGINNKADAIKHAKFVLAYENAQYDGYISEKIFDVMAAGAVPVYLGAPNITDYVPKECFINQNDFDSFEALYTYLKNMPDETYNGYMDCIKTFMRKQKHYNNYGTFAELLLTEIFDTVPLWEKAWFHFNTYIESTLTDNRFFEHILNKHLKGYKKPSVFSHLNKTPSNVLW